MINFHNNKHTFRFVIVFLIFLFGKNGIAQTGITGKITDKETKEDLIFANIEVYQNGVFIQGTTTNIDGDYNIRVYAGTYQIEVSYTGYATQRITKIIVNENQIAKINVQLDGGGFIDCWGGCLWNYKIPLIKQGQTSTELTISSEKIKNLPTRNINEIITITPGVTITQ